MLTPAQKTALKSNLRNLKAAADLAIQHIDNDEDYTVAVSCINTFANRIFQNWKRFEGIDQEEEG